jgi:hypothetical protein
MDVKEFEAIQKKIEVLKDKKSNREYHGRSQE